jgi:hypothetical protein
MVSPHSANVGWTTIVTIRYVPPQVVCGQGFARAQKVVGRKKIRECEMRTLVASRMALSQRLGGPVEALRRRR